MNLFRRAMYSDKFWKWPAIIGLAIVAAVLLAGCASEPYWRQLHEPYAEKYISVVRAKSYEDLVSRCRFRSISSVAGRLHGCAVRMPNLCLIVLAPDADSCTLSHERKHCAGWDHSDRTAFVTDCGDGS